MLAVEGFAGCALRAFVSRLVGGATVDGKRAVGRVIERLWDHLSVLVRCLGREQSDRN